MPEAAVPTAPDGVALAEEFWTFAVAFYARAEVAADCLRLQDEHGLDVNILLLCCFLARSGRGRLTAADLAAAEARAAPWRAGVIAPLRAARRALKTMSSSASSPAVNALYTEIKRSELAAEREEQRLLLASWSAPPFPSSDPVGDAAASLALYLITHGLPAEAGDTLIRALRTTT